MFTLLRHWRNRWIYEGAGKFDGFCVKKPAWRKSAGSVHLLSTAGGVGLQQWWRQPRRCSRGHPGPTVPGRCPGARPRPPLTGPPPPCAPERRRQGRDWQSWAEPARDGCGSHQSQGIRGFLPWCKCQLCSHRQWRSLRGKKTGKISKTYNENLISITQMIITWNCSLWPSYFSDAMKQTMLPSNSS